VLGPARERAFETRPAAGYQRLRLFGQDVEQATMFIVDPSGNAIESKSFRDPARLFAR